MNGPSGFYIKKRRWWQVRHYCILNKMARKRLKSSSLPRLVKKKGCGVLNTLINKLPVELHIPGYNYCGPGTKLNVRLKRNDKGINLLDEACKEHDIAYSVAEELPKRHVADRKLYERALERIKSKDSSVGEKLAATVIAGVMKGKTALGMGLGTISTLSDLRRKKAMSVRRRLGRRKIRGGVLTFFQALKRARDAIKRGGRSRSVLENSKIAYGALKDVGKKRKILNPRHRVIPIPKSGGFLPLIPLFAALGALGSLSGGAAAIAKAVNDAKTARDQLKEANRHNLAMEAKAVGKGFYIKPYKSGCGLFLPAVSKNG